MKKMSKNHCCMRFFSIFAKSLIKFDLRMT